MKFKLLAACMLSLALVSPAVAQSAPDDLHCFMLSNVFAKAAKDERGKAVAAQSALYYLGRIDGHLDPKALAGIIHSRLDPKTAGPQMTACAQRVAHADQTLHQMMQAVAGKH